MANTKSIMSEIGEAYARLVSSHPPSPLRALIHASVEAESFAFSDRKDAVAYVREMAR